MLNVSYDSQGDAEIDAEGRDARALAVACALLLWKPPANLDVTLTIAPPTDDAESEHEFHVGLSCAGNAVTTIEVAHPVTPDDLARLSKIGAGLVQEAWDAVMGLGTGFADCPRCRQREQEDNTTVSNHIGSSHAVRNSIREGDPEIAKSLPPVIPF